MFSFNYHGLSWYRESISGCCYPTTRSAIVTSQENNTRLLEAHLNIAIGVEISPSPVSLDNCHYIHHRFSYIFALWHPPPKMDHHDGGGLFMMVGAKMKKHLEVQGRLTIEPGNIARRKKVFSNKKVMDWARISI